MILKSIIQVKRISVIVILMCIMTFCSHVRHSSSQKVFFFIIDDFIIDYNLFYPDKKIEAILAFIQFENTKVSHIVILDYPLQLLYRDIRNKKISDTLVAFGVYKNIPVKLSMSSDVDSQLMAFFSNDSLLTMKAQELPQYYDNDGNKINISIDAIMEYEPFLISKYLIKDEIKKIEMIDGKMLNRKFSIKNLNK